MCAYLTLLTPLPIRLITRRRPWTASVRCCLSMFLLLFDTPVIPCSRSSEPVKRYSERQTAQAWLRKVQSSINPSLKFKNSQNVFVLSAHLTTSPWQFLQGRYWDYWVPMGLGKRPFSIFCSVWPPQAMAKFLFLAWILGNKDERFSNGSIFHLPISRFQQTFLFGKICTFFQNSMLSKTQDRQFVSYWSFLR